MIVITLSLWTYFDRVNFLININYYRMRQIEDELGMRKNWLVHILDHRNQMSGGQRGRFTDLLNTYPPRPLWRFWARTWYTPPTGRWSIRGIFLALIILWMVLIVVVFLN
ncbi:MAG: hypothetical protein OEZ00_00990 [Dehalococcoidia bacterium]|nr:hypothetical protein [Dehalococcoidia bacterium]